MKNINIAIVIVLIIIAGLLSFIAFKKPAKEIVEIPINNNPVTQVPSPKPTPTQTTSPQNVPASVTYKNHGFTVDLPKGFVVTEQPSEGGPSIIINLPNSSIMNYVSNALFWTQNVLPSYSYIGTETVGTTTFSVYNYSGHKLYWFAQGNVGYEFSGDKELLKTFKFVGWQ